MSLFGEFDEPAVPTNPSKSRLSLFDDESPTPGSKSSLFADDDDVSGGSPWDMPTPKRAGREDLLKNLLPASDVPDSYIDTFDRFGMISRSRLRGVAFGISFLFRAFEFILFIIAIA